MELHNHPSEYTLYLACSPEDEPYDRDALGNLIRAINDIYQERHEGVYLRLQESEFLPGGAEKADLIISLSLRHEGDHALAQMLREVDHADLPPSLFFFRQLEDSEVTKDREEFRQFLENGPKHYWTSYQDIGYVHACILMHLMRHLNIPVEFRSDRLQMGQNFVFTPEDFATLRNSPAMQSLHEELERCEAECASLRQQNSDYLSDPQYHQASERLADLRQKKQQISQNFFNLLKQFMQQKQEGSLTQRQQRMQEALTQGDLDAAIRVMDRQEIEQDQQDTVRQIRELEAHIAQLKARIGQNVTELLSRIQMLQMQPGTSMEDVDPLYQTAMGWEKDYDLPRKAWSAYIDDLIDYGRIHLAGQEAAKYMDYAVEAGSDAKQAKAHNWLALCAMRRKDTSNALDHYRKAEELYRMLKDSDPQAYFTHWAYAFLNLAGTMNRAGQRLGAIEKLEPILNTLKQYEQIDKVASRAAQAGAYLQLETFFRHKDWEQAYEYCLQAKALYDELDDPAYGYERFVCNVALINCLLALDRGPEAQTKVDLLEESVLGYVHEDLHNRMHELAIWLNTKARVILRKKQATDKERSQAKEYLQNADSILALHKKTYGDGDPGIEALEVSIDRRMAFLYLDRDNSAALYYCNKADIVLQDLVKADPGVHLSTMADNHVFMAQIYDRWDDQEQVKEHLMHAIRLIQENPNIAIFSMQELASTCVHLASVILKTGDRERAATVLPFVTEQARQLTGDGTSEALLDYALGLLYSALEKWTEAADAFRPVQRQLDDSVIKLDAAYAFGVYLGLGRALCQQKRFREALPHLKNAQQTYVVFNEVSSHVLDQTVELARLMVKTYNKLNRAKEAKDIAQWGNEQKEKRLKKLNGGRV